MDYQEYITSQEWMERRWRKIRDDGSVMVRCEQCHGFFPVAMIQVHHLTYERLGREENRDLQILCRDCHKREHGIETTTPAAITMSTRVETVQSAMKTGFANLDQATGGIQPGELIVLGSRPSIGKSALALCIARHVAVDQQLPVMFISLEQNREEVGIRLISQQSRVPCSVFYSEEPIPAEQKQRLEGAHEVLKKSTMLIRDDATMTVEEVIGSVDKYARENPIRLLVIDYVQLLDLPKTDDFMDKQLTRALRQIREACKSLQLVCLALTGLKRSVEARTDCIPTIQDFYGGGEIEHDADQVWALWRKSHYDNEESKDARMFVLRSRRAEPSSVNLVWTPETVTFSEPQSAEWSE